MSMTFELLIHGYELTLRLDDASKIEVEEISTVDNALQEPPPTRISSPPRSGRRR